MKIETVTFINEKNKKSFNSFDDFGFLIKEFNISEAPIQEESVKIPGTSQILDFSRTLSGDTNYDRRTITIILNKRADIDYLPEYSKLQNSLHGQQMKIIYSEDSNFYWFGKVKVSGKDLFQIVDEVTLICDVDPFKYDISASDEDWIWDSFSFEYGIINETKDLVVENELEVVIIANRMPSYPIIKCSNSMQLEFNGQNIELVEGSQEVLDAEIVEGENTFKFVGNGIVTISYRGGSL